MKLIDKRKHLNLKIDRKLLQKYDLELVARNKNKQLVVWYYDNKNKKTSGE